MDTLCKSYIEGGGQEQSGDAMGVIDGGEIKLVENKVIRTRVNAFNIIITKNKRLHAISIIITKN